MIPVHFSVLACVLLVGVLGAQEQPIKLSEQERAILNAQFDRNKDGTLDETERERALGRADRNHDGTLSAKEAGNLKEVAQRLLITQWFNAIGDQSSEQQKSAHDLIRIQTTHSLLTASGYTAWVRVNWGDLNKLIKKGGKDVKSDWDGTCTLAYGKCSVVAELAFDDGTAAIGSPGNKKSGDRLANVTGATIHWSAATFGATDGLLIRCELPSAESKGVITAGGFTLPFVITPMPRGVTLPNGQVTR